MELAAPPDRGIAATCEWLADNSGTVLSRPKRVTPMFEVPSRDALDGKSFGVKLRLKQGMVEEMVEFDGPKADIAQGFRLVSP